MNEKGVQTTNESKNWQTIENGREESLERK